MKTFREFVEEINLINENPVLRAALGGAMMGGLPKYAVDTLKLMNRLPVKAPAIRGTFKTPLPKPNVTRVSNPSGNPISAVVSALTNLQGSTPQSGAAAERAKANREAQIQQRYGDAMNKTPSRFGKAGPDVPKTMANIPPAEAQPGSPSYVAPTQSRSVTTERPSAPRPKPSGPITTAQAGDNVSTPKSAISTYRDKADTKGLSVGRYKTLAQHRAAVAAQKNKM